MQQHLFTLNKKIIFVGVFFYHKTISKDIIYLQKKLGFKNKI